MAHNIHKNNMVFSGETPWHGLGTKLPANGTWEQIVDAAGFYQADAMPLFTRINGEIVQVPDRKAIVRADMKGNSGYLATVGHAYEVIQFSDLATAGVIASAGMRAIWHTAGTLGVNGARGWMLAELPEQYQIKVAGDPSVIKPYVLLTTAHDGSGAAVMANVATRVVCQNTLGIALGERGGAKWAIRHTKNAQQRLDDAARAFRAQCSRMEKFGELANALVKCRLNDEAFEAAIAAAVPIPEDGANHPRLEKRRDEIRGMRESFMGVSNAIKGTAWGDFQALTEALDWPDRKLDSMADRVESQALGAAAVAKSRVLEVITSAAGLSLPAVMGR